LYTPKVKRDTIQATIIVNDPDQEEVATIQSIKTSLLNRNQVVAVPHFFNAEEDQRDHETVHFYTYNKPIESMRIQDVLTCRAFLETRFLVDNVNLVGLGKAGLWTLLAAPFCKSIQKVAVDANQFDSNQDELFVNDFFVPGLRKSGDFKSAQGLIAPTPLLVHNTNGVFDTSWAKVAYETEGVGHLLRVHESALDADKIVQWILEL